MLKLEKTVISQGGFKMTADWTILRGQRVAVIGPSGAGKSTLLAAIAGFLPVQAGRMLWEGRDITQAFPADRQMTMLFQDNNLFPHLTITQNVGLGIRPDLRLSSREKNRVAEALDQVGLSDHAVKRPAALSGGQQSRAALARVLVQARPLVLLDEPFAALGPALRDEMLDLLVELTKETGAALMMVTHAPEDVERIAEHVIFVEGAIAHTPRGAADLMNNPPPELRAYLGNSYAAKGAVTDKAAFAASRPLRTK